MLTKFQQDLSSNLNGFFLLGFVFSHEDICSLCPGFCFPVTPAHAMDTFTRASCTTWLISTHCAVRARECLSLKASFFYTARKFAVDVKHMIPILYSLHPRT